MLQIARARAFVARSHDCKHVAGALRLLQCWAALHTRTDATTAQRERLMPVQLHCTTDDSREVPTTL